MNEHELADLQAVASRHPAVELYIFGSTIHGYETPVDLDVLAVYATLQDFVELRADLDRQSFAPLIDLVAMTPDELCGSGFLSRSGAVPLTDLSETPTASRRLSSTASMPSRRPPTL